MPFDSWLAPSYRLLPLLLLGIGCNKLFAKDTPAPAGEEGKAEAAKHDDAPAAGKDEHGKEKEEASPGRYGVPFAWEISPDEPLAKARGFMAEVLKANEVFMNQGSSHFSPMLDAETPRATVLTCADSRVQAPAWDSQPENDDYTVRNLGNQVSTSIGSIEYGIERLHTPVLLIIGHTGCSAVQAALDKSEKGKDAIAAEVASIKLPEGRRSKDSSEALTAAVVANVNAQVAEAVGHFSEHVQSGDLTVVGAVYDLHNAFDDGNGRMQLVNVNGNMDDARIDAFEKAVREAIKPDPPKLGQRRSSLGSASGGITGPTVLPPSIPGMVDRSGRPLPGAPRATINAVNLIGEGDAEAISSGNLRMPALRPGSMVPGTSDLRVAPPAQRISPSPSPARREITGPTILEPPPDPHGEGKSSEAKSSDKHGEGKPNEAKSGDKHGAADEHAPADKHGAAPAKKEAPKGHGEPAEHAEKPEPGHH